jgi:hypothetical protein
MHMLLRLCGLGLLALALAGCAGDSYLGARATTVQSSFDHLNCEQLQNSINGTQKRIDELVALQDKAAQGAGGSVIGAAVYGPTLAQARGHMRIYREAREAKRCGIGGSGATPLY